MPDTHVHESINLLSTSPTACHQGVDHPSTNRRRRLDRLQSRFHFHVDIPMLAHQSSMGALSPRQMLESPTAMGHCHGSSNRLRPKRLWPCFLSVLDLTETADDHEI